jgi:hypothetical protein
VPERGAGGGFCERIRESTARLAPFGAFWTISAIEKPHFARLFAPEGGPDPRNFFLVPRVVAEIPGIFARFPQDHPATIVTRDRRNIHLYLMLRHDPIMVACGHDR